MIKQIDCSYNQQVGEVDLVPDKYKDLILQLLHDLKNHQPINKDGLIEKTSSINLEEFQKRASDSSIKFK